MWLTNALARMAPGSPTSVLVPGACEMVSFVYTNAVVQPNL